MRQELCENDILIFYPEFLHNTPSNYHHIQTKENRS